MSIAPVSAGDDRGGAVSGQPARRSAAIDALRGLAILQVVIWHYFAGIGQQIAPFKILYNLSWSGVDLFFVLSGFLIGGILLDHKNSEAYYLPFYGRRFLRIIPLYSIVLIIFFSTNHYTIEGFNWVWPYLTFTQNFLGAKFDDWGPQWTLVTWSLAVEEQFYLILPVLIRHVPASRLPWVCAAMVGMAPLARWLSADLIFHNTTAAYVLLPCRMDALFLGVLAAWAVRQPTILTLFFRGRIGLLTIATFLGGLLLRFSLDGQASPIEPLMDGIGLTVVALFYTLVVLLVVTTKRHGVPLAARPLCWLGLGAYSLYLFHLPLLQFVRSTLIDSTHGHAAVALAAVLSLPVALVAWFAVERPAIAFGHRAFRYHGTLKNSPIAILTMATDDRP